MEEKKKIIQKLMRRFREFIKLSKVWTENRAMQIFNIAFQLRKFLINMVEIDVKMKNLTTM